MYKPLTAEYEPLQDPQDEIIQGNKYFVIEAGNSCNSHQQILQKLHQQRPGLKRVNRVEECHVIFVFCPIASRAGTDIQAALQLLDTFSATKPVIFVVLHHTFEPDKMVPDSSRMVNRVKTLTVDCLFHESTGLLECWKNNEALKKIAEKFKIQDRVICLLISFVTVAVILILVIWMST